MVWKRDESGIGRVRSSLVLSIPPSEAHIFVTKGKVPYLISVEVFDPLEVACDPLQDQTPRWGSDGVVPPAPPSESRDRSNNNKSKKTGDEVVKESVDQLLDAQASPGWRKGGKKRTAAGEEAVTIEISKKQRQILERPGVVVQDFQDKLDESRRKIKGRGMSELRIHRESEGLGPDDETRCGGGEDGGCGKQTGFVGRAAIA